MNRIVDYQFFLIADAAFCAPDTDAYTFGTHNLTWNATNTGQTAYSSCPEGFDGRINITLLIKHRF